MAALDADAVAAVDSTGQAGEILDLPVHLRDALWRVDSAGLQPGEPAGGLIVAGMGGSGIGGRLALGALGSRATRPLSLAAGYALPPWATADSTVLCSSYSGGLIVAGMGGSGIGGRLALGALGPRATRPLSLAAGYTLPPWATADSTVLCSSYSGGTEETLSCYDAAGELGARRIVATTGGALAERARRDGVPVIPLPGGFQPRAAVGYAMVVTLEVAALAGVGPSLRAEVEAAAALAERLAAEWGPGSPEDSEAKRLARALHGSVAVVMGAELTAGAAYRWKTQLNENANVPAFSAELPELDHNELVGWDTAAEHGRFAAVFLDDEDTHPRTRARVDLTAELIRTGAAAVEVVRSRGASRTERVVSLVLLGDLVSLYAAVLRGTDPEQIDVLHALKARLADL